MGRAGGVAAEAREQTESTPGAGSCHPEGAPATREGRPTRRGGSRTAGAVLLTEEQYANLVHLAYERQVSQSEVVREASIFFFSSFRRTVSR